MSTETRLFLNLASRPARNRRLFRSVSGFLWLLTAAFVFITGTTWLNTGVEKTSLQRTIEETERLSREARSEESRFATRIEEAEKALGTKVAIINSIILRKTFPWTGLFAHLEASLPDPSFITSLSPNFADDATLDLKIQVVSRSLEYLVLLINNLAARGFRDILVANESRDADGRIIAELSLTYERAY